MRISFAADVDRLSRVMRELSSMRSAQELNAALEYIQARGEAMLYELRQEEITNAAAAKRKRVEDRKKNSEASTPKEKE